MYRKRDYCIRGENVVLVPYQQHHVMKYNEWMQDDLLRQQTASERLTLEQEYLMQQEWMKDDNSKFHCQA